ENRESPAPSARRHRWRGHHALSRERRGPWWDGAGVHFRVLSRHATEIRLCLFDTLDATTASSVVELEAGPDDGWAAYVEGIGPGQIYGFRADGPWEPSAGYWFTPNQLLLDPSALAIAGDLHWDPTIYAADPEAGGDAPSGADSAGSVPRSVVVDHTFDWQGVDAPERSWEETLIYECHVKGMTWTHPEIPQDLRGTYGGMAHEVIVDHLKSLGVTAVELLPVQQSLTERQLSSAGLRNYFGYNPIGFFAPHGGYARSELGGQVAEFKTMVRELHRAGIEVILDVVFNHTAEGNHQGPTLSLRGLDNRSFYRLESDRRHYENYSGCGNTIDFRNPLVTRWVLDCLRYWVEEMKIDGFRFDLATVLGRTDAGFDPASDFLRRATEDPLLSKSKLIAEPWDVGRDGYRLGDFPPPWAEWNDRFRDATRRTWRGERGTARELALRLSGSPDIFVSPPRGPSASINFVTCHDGFTLEDLVSYERKHNGANGEANHDGHNNNLSRNWGVEGPTSSAAILEQRARAKRNLFATLALAEGVPMVSHGDELGRTQMGNNNAYCQDNELAWIDWQLEPAQQQFLAFVQETLALRRALGIAAPEIDRECRLISIHGRGCSAADWLQGAPPIFGLLRHSAAVISLVIVNNDSRGHLFQLPNPTPQGRWWRILDTANPGRHPLRKRAVRVAPDSLMLLGSSASGDEP
ncbi:MAG: glycogen debranching protein GlgX, partial [Acidobacteriota bacterium]